MFLLYNILLTLLSPFWVPWMLLKARRRAERPNWAERQGRFEIPPRGDRRRIWIHAVSVGEFVAATPILRELRKTLPNHEIVVSVTTSSGHQTARDAEPGLFDHLVYFPIDVARFQLSAMQRVWPDVVAIMETELWMNFVWAAKSFGARTLLINGRISDKSYPVVLRLKAFYRALLREVDLCLMQSQTDVERIKAVGAGEARVGGNSKFDQAASNGSDKACDWRKELALDPSKFTVLVGLTRGEEEERLVLQAMEIVGFGSLNVVHAPRHMERAEPLGALVLERTGAVAFRSRHETGPYLVLDTYGELASIYSAADLVVIGGGFEDFGGQNIIQPLAHGKPVLHGPHMQNFRDVAALAADAGATMVCATAAELAGGVKALMADPARRATMGNQARELVQRNLGASCRYAEIIAAEASKAK